jgi:hypothetical protein
MQNGINRQMEKMPTGTKGRREKTSVAETKKMH